MKKVVVYSSSTCPACHQAMDYLDSKNIPYEQHNITTDPEAKRFLIKNKIMGVPAIYIDDQLVMGFNQAKIDELLGL